MPTKAERDKAVRLWHTMVDQMLRDTFTPEVIANAARSQALLDFVNGTIDWAAAPPEIQAKFIKKPTASDDDFTAALNEARESRKK